MSFSLIPYYLVVYIVLPLVLQTAELSRVCVEEPTDFAEEPAPSEEISISLRKENQELVITVNEEQVAEDDLPALLKNIAQKNPGQKIIISPQADIPSIKVRNLLDACTQAGLSEVYLTPPFL